MLYLLKAKADINAAPGLFGGFLNLVVPFKGAIGVIQGYFGFGVEGLRLSGLGFRA